MRELTVTNKNPNTTTSSDRRKMAAQPHKLLGPA